MLGRRTLSVLKTVSLRNQKYYLKSGRVLIDSGHFACPSQCARQVWKKHSSTDVGSPITNLTSTKNKNTNKLKHGQKKTAISLTQIFASKSKMKCYPRSWEVSYLARQFGAAKIDVDRAEALLVKELHIKSFDSLKEYSDKWKSLEKPSEKLEVFRTLLSAYQKIEEQMDYKNKKSRLSYFISLWRLAIVIQDCVEYMKGHNVELEEAIDVGSLVLSEYKNPSLLYLTTMALLKQNSKQSLRSARINVIENPIILEELIANVRHYSSKDFTQQHEKPSTATHPGLPFSFIMGDLNVFADRVKSLDLDVKWGLRFDAYKSLGLWNAGHRSEGLAGIAATFETWSKTKLSDDDNVAVGRDLVVSFSDIVKDIVVENLEPAHEFLDIFCEKIPFCSSKPIVPYVYFIHLKACDSPKADLLLKKFKDIQVNRHAKFEKSLNNDGMTIETKNFFTGDFLKAEAKVGEEEPSEQTIAKVEDVKVKFSMQVQQEMLDIQVLKLSQEQMFDEAIKAVQEGVDQDIEPTNVSVMMLAENLFDLMDTRRLNALRSALPWGSEAGQKIYELEKRATMRSIYAKWNGGAKEIALEEALMTYQLVLEDDCEIQYETYERVLGIIGRYLKFFLEDFVSAGQSRALLNVKKFGTYFSDNHRHFTVLCMYWEALFFSPTYEHQVMANDFLQENPKVPRHLDFDSALERAVEYNKDTLLRKLLEIALQFDLDMYNKSRCVQTLLAFQCDSGNMRGAKDVLKYAHERDVVIEADAMKVYLDFEAAHKRSRGALSIITDLFSKEKKK